jgi:hypothetical protein
MFRFTAAALIVLSFSAAAARAADNDDASTAGSARVVITLPPVATPEKRPAILPFLYLSLAGLQAYDVYSTRAGVARGGAELNPFVAPVAGNTTGMIVMKAVSTATTIVMAERLWHRNKAAAILTMVAANGVMAVVAANNARVLQQTR